jgi:L-alanine-DL-glutamate epimerase-like enolase superfamily enzyme
MKITQIDLWHASIPLERAFYPSWIPGFPQTENRFTLVRLRTDDGLEGWSAGAALSTERSGLGSLLGPYLLGERADDIASIRQRIREMGYLGMRIGWLEAACWDIVGKARNAPVWQLLGGKPCESVELYASTGQVKRGAERVKELEQRLSEGFKAVKLRVHDDTLEQDVQQIRDARKGIGDAAVLGVDANQAWRVAVVANAPKWSFERAHAFCSEAAQLGFAWVEEPLAMDDYDGLAKLRASTDIELAGGELNNQGLPEFGVMLEKGCYDWYQPDATFTGGIAETWQIIQKVKEHGDKYTPHTWTNGIGFAINLQLFGASPWRDETRLEYPLDAPWVPEVRDGLLKEPWLHQRGRLRLPTAPGLGFEIDPRALRRHAKHFFTATRLRVAVSTVLDKGVSTALEAGRTRDDRLAKREQQLEAMKSRGEDVALTSLSTAI